MYPRTRQFWVQRPRDSARNSAAWGLGDSATWGLGDLGLRDSASQVFEITFEIRASEFSGNASTSWRIIGLRNNT